MSSSLLGTLRKGQACICCRRRKTKCDGRRPVCIQCATNGRELDCEYSDGVTPTRTERLQAHLAQLQIRVQELEVTRSQRSRSSGATAPLQISPPLSIQSPTQWWASDMPPAHIARILINTFASHSHQICMGMDIRALETSIATNPINAGHHHKALINSIFLWGARLSRSDALSTPESEQALYSRALSFLQTYDVATLSPQYGLQAVQAEILLATYLFTCGGRTLETDLRISSAVRLALGLGMNYFNPGNSIDPLNNAENINVFWNLFILDQTWAIVNEKPAIIRTYGNSRISITTPWPLTRSAILQNETYLPGNGIEPLTQFEGEAGLSSSGSSPLALAVKGTYLCHRAVQFSPLRTASDETRSLDVSIFNFISTLPQIGASMHPANKSYLISIHAVSYYSFIKLHELHAQEDPSAYKRCVQAARYISMLLGSFAPEEAVEPCSLVLPCFVTASKIIIREITRIRQMAEPQQDEISTRTLIMELDRLMYVLADLSEVFTVAEPQLDVLQEMRRTMSI